MSVCDAVSAAARGPFPLIFPSVLLLMRSNEAGASVGTRSRSGGKINRAKQTWRGLSSVAPRYTHKHTLESHKHTFAKEVSGPVTGGYRETEMTVLRMEVLNRAPLAGLCESVSA